MADLSKFSTADLEAISNGKLGAVSDQGLQMLHDSVSEDAAPKEPGFFNGAVKNTIDSLPMIGGIAGGILGTPGDVIAGPMGNVAGAAIGGYAGTAAKNFINSYYDPQSAPKTLTDAITQPVVGGIEQGLMQGTGEAVAPLIGRAVQAAGAGAKSLGVKALSNTFGAKPANIQEYLQFSKRINAAPSEEALKQISDEYVGKLASDVEAKKISSDQAQEALKSFQSDLKDAYKTKGYDARDAATSAQQAAKDAHNARLQQLSGDVYDSVNRLKDDVQTGSDKALEILDKSNAKIDLAPVYSQIDDEIGRLQKAGTDESLAVADKLNSYKDRLQSTHGDSIFGPDAKKLIKGLDQTTKYSHMAGAFDDVKNASFKSVRAALDTSLKGTVDEYAKAMKPVAADADLLSRISDFGDKQSAVGYLKNINAPNQMERRAALQELGNKYGADFVAGAQPENLPEQALVNKTQANLESLRPDRVAEKLDQSVMGSRQKQAADAAQSAYTQAQDKLAPFKPLAPNAAGQTQAQAKLAQLAKGGNIETERMFRELGKLTDTDFIQAMKDRNVLAAFQKGSTNGSRNTLMGAVAGFAFGGVGGAGIGAAAGRAVDQWGPAITKKILDGAIRVSERPTVATIRALELPEPIKRNMIMGLENYLSRGKGAGGVTSALPDVASQTKSDVNRSPAKGPEAWASRGAQALGIQDQDAQTLLSTTRGKQLLIQASDLKPGSKAMKAVQTQIQAILKGAK